MSDEEVDLTPSVKALTNHLSTKLIQMLEKLDENGLQDPDFDKHSEWLTKLYTLSKEIYELE